HDLTGTAFDGTAFDGTVSTGNDVYIYDINTQSVLWRLSDALPTLQSELSAVHANVRAISLNNDTTVDHLYVSDVDGQIFR
ncbi:hypothetical protein DF186_22930, partial [Enterococcus hirae]